jgi:hypothetical protein
MLADIPFRWTDGYMAVDVLNGADDMDVKKNDPEQVLSRSIPSH